MVINMSTQNNVDLSPVLSNLFQAVLSWITSFFNLLDNIYIFPNVSLLTVLIVLTVLTMLFSAIFVVFGGSDYED